jgi:hypothetical protein
VTWACHAQFVDDVLDFTGSTMQLGKPALNDLRSGLATAPVLFAAEEHPELQPLILRRFKSEGAHSFPSLLTGWLEMPSTLQHQSCIALLVGSSVRRPCHLASGCSWRRATPSWRT